MPTYEYRCPAGHEFELFQKISSKPAAKCPTCGMKAERRISGGAGFVFKGSGFYITDYGKDGKGPRKVETESTSSDDGGKGSDSVVKEASPAGDKPSTSKPKAKGDTSSPASNDSKEKG